MESVLKDIINTKEHDKIPAMIEFLKSLGILSLKDLVKTSHDELKASPYFNPVVIGKLKRRLKDEDQYAHQVFDSKSTKKLEEQKNYVQKRGLDIKQAGVEIEHAENCEKREMKMLENERKEFQGRLDKLNRIKNDIKIYGNKSHEWNDFEKEVDGAIDHANYQMSTNRTLEVKRRNHYKLKKEKLQKTFLN